MTQSYIGIVELKACPFCGKAPTLDDFNTSYRPDSPPSWCVLCKGPCDVEVCTRGHDTQAEAIAAWNTRDPIITEMVEALEGLEKAEARYRYAHDILGTGDPKTGRAWDLMRRAGDDARTTLAKVRSK